MYSLFATAVQGPCRQSDFSALENHINLGQMLQVGKAVSSRQWSCLHGEMKFGKEQVGCFHLLQNGQEPLADR